MRQIIGNWKRQSGRKKGYKSIFRVAFPLSGGDSFPLKDNGDGACGIPDSNGKTIVMTGGYNAITDRGHNNVTR